MDKAFLTPLHPNKDKNYREIQTYSRPSKILELFPSKSTDNFLMLPEVKNINSNVYNDKYQTYLSSNSNISQDSITMNHLDPVNNLTRRYSGIDLSNNEFILESKPYTNKKNMNKFQDIQMPQKSLERVKNSDLQNWNLYDNISGKAKNVFSLEAEECGCVNPGAYHACSSRLACGDSFGILNPTFEDEDPKRVLKEYKDSQILPNKSVSKSKNLKSQRKSSINSSANFQDSATLETSSNKSSYSDFLAAFSPLYGGAAYSFFSPSDLKEELLFPLPISTHNNVLENPNAKEATFYIGKPKMETEQNMSSDPKPPSSTSSSLTKTMTDISVSKHLPIQPIPHISVSSFQPESSNQQNKGDNYERGEYLKYKNSSDSHLNVDQRDDDDDVNSKSLGVNPPKMLPLSKRRYSCGARNNNLISKEHQRKTSLPSEECFTKYCDVSSVFENALSASMKYIYHPLPSEIFDSSNTKRDDNKQPNTTSFKDSLIDYNKLDLNKKTLSVLKQQKKSKCNSKTLQLDLQKDKFQLHKANLKPNRCENAVSDLTSCQSSFLTQSIDCNCKDLENAASHIKFNKKKKKVSEVLRRKSKEDEEQTLIEGTERRGAQNVKKRKDIARRFLFVCFFWRV